MTRGGASLRASSSLLPAAVFLTGLSPCGGGTTPPIDEPDPIVPFVVAVDADEAIAHTGPRFVSFTVDVDRLRLREDGEPGLDWNDARLRRMVQELAPAVLRVGGTVADSIYYDLDDALATPPEPYISILRGSTWDETCALAAELDLEIAFTLNAGDGPRNADLSWSPDTARAFIERSKSVGCPVTVWELGNEVSSWWAEPDVVVTRTPAEYAEDFATARALLDEIDPDAALAGPASAYWPVYGELGSSTTFLPEFLAAAGPTVDVVTWHYYPTQSDRCPAPSVRAREEAFLDPDTFDEMLAWADIVEAARDESAPDAQVWLGETANAQCGGQEGLSDRFVAGPWWLDQLGLLARRGQEVVARQSLDGGRYHLIDAETRAPYPDYFNSILWRRLMGEAVLDPHVLSAPPPDAPDAGAGAFDPAHLRLYAHCTPDRAGAVTVLALNLDASSPAHVSFAGLGDARELWLLTSLDPLSTEIRLNGDVLSVHPDGSPPEMAGAPASDPIEIPGASYAFVVLADAAATACD